MRAEKPGAQKILRSGSLQGLSKRAGAVLEADLGVTSKDFDRCKIFCASNFSGQLRSYSILKASTGVILIARRAGT